MDFEFYRNFIIVAETGNISAAAKKLNLAQPALSSQLHKLEDYYGVKLINTGRGIRALNLTPAGETFLEKARQICYVEESIALDMQIFNKQTSGILRFSISPAKSNFFINHYLLPFSEKYPEISYRYKEEAVNMQIKHVLDGSSDFAFANAPLPASHNFSCHKSGKEYFYLIGTKENTKLFNTVLPEKHPESICIKNLEEVSLCCNFGCYSILRKSCQDRGFSPRIRFLATTNTGVLEFAKGNNCLAIVAVSGPEEIPADFKALTFKDGELYFDQTLFRSSKERMTHAAALFLNFFLRKRLEEGDELSPSEKNFIKKYRNA